MSAFIVRNQSLQNSATYSFNVFDGVRFKHISYSKNAKIKNVTLKEYLTSICVLIQYSVEYFCNQDWLYFSSFK